MNAHLDQMLQRRALEWIGSRRRPARRCGEAGDERRDGRRKCEHRVAQQAATLDVRVVARVGFDVKQRNGTRKRRVWKRGEKLGLKARRKVDEKSVTARPQCVRVDAEERVHWIGHVLRRR
jgi:hypothetical protein